MNLIVQKTAAQVGRKGIVGAVIIFNHGLKFGIVFLVSDHPAHEKLIASKKSFFLSNN
jgi:hypothetical protein